jgi:hypothetical protein
MTTYPSQTYGQQTQPGDDVNDLVMGGEGGRPYLLVGPETDQRAAHTQPNEFKGGRITAMRKVPAYKLGRTDPVTGQRERIPLVYEKGAKAGQPIFDVILTVQTGERDPENPDDDGQRQLRIDGFDPYWLPQVDHNSRKRALRLAVLAAQATKFEIGGEFYIAWTHKVPTGSIPAINWVGKYAKPDTSMTPEGVGQPQGQQYAPQAPQQPQGQQWAPQHPQQHPVTGATYRQAQAAPQQPYGPPAAQGQQYRQPPVIPAPPVAPASPVAPAPQGQPQHGQSYVGQSAEPPF